jgi:hypothetical protein
MKLPQLESFLCPFLPSPTLRGATRSRHSENGFITHFLKVPGRKVEELLQRGREGGEHRSNFGLNSKENGRGVQALSQTQGLCSCLDSGFSHSTLA